MKDAQPNWIDAIISKVFTVADRNGIIRVSVTLVFPHVSNEELTRELISSQAATTLVSFRQLPVLNVPSSPKPRKEKEE